MDYDYGKAGYPHVEKDAWVVCDYEYDYNYDCDVKEPPSPVILATPPPPPPRTHVKKPKAVNESRRRSFVQSPKGKNGDCFQVACCQLV